MAKERRPDSQLMKKQRVIRNRQNNSKGDTKFIEIYRHEYYCRWSNRFIKGAIVVLLIWSPLCCYCLLCYCWSWWIPGTIKAKTILTSQFHTLSDTGADVTTIIYHKVAMHKWQFTLISISSDRLGFITSLTPIKIIKKCRITLHAHFTQVYWAEDTLSIINSSYYWIWKINWNK